MAMYRVTWEIDVEADDPREAAEVARASQADKDTTATVFSVLDIHGTGQLRTIDLAEPPAPPGDQADGPAQEEVDWANVYVHPYSVGSFGAAVYEPGRNGISRQVAVTRRFDDADAIVKAVKGWFASANEAPRSGAKAGVV